MLSAPNVHKDFKLYLQGLIFQAIREASTSPKHEPLRNLDQDDRDLSGMETFTGRQ